MGKDLRTLAVHHKLRRYPALDGKHWGLKNPQPFFPPLETLFKTETVSSLADYGIRLTEDIDTVLSETHIKTSKGATVPVHRKTTMLLSPFKWMRGDYGVLGLPKPETIAADVQAKLQSQHSAGYVGALASIALSESGCAHFPKVYGVYVGLAGSHTIDISDDYEDLSERHWFANNLGKTFELKLRQAEGSASFQHTRGQRPGVVLGEGTGLDDLIVDVDADHVSEPSLRSRSESQVSDGSFVEDDDTTEESDDAYEICSCDCSDSESEDDEEDDDAFAWATFKDAPVITTVMEKLDGTFYDLLDLHPEAPEKHAAWVAQIVFALAFAQRTYGFTHNDLHGNNVMYVPTTQEFFYYKHQGTCYKVPTYGYLLKLIDFDRAIFSLRLTGMKDPRHFVSSQFQTDDEAAGQHNIEPFFVSTHPRVPPNPSFDLCRFATSVFWDMFPEGPKHPYTHPLFEVFKQWMTQADGTSVCYRAKGDRHDRYHGFDLYKAITRYCKDSATPRREIGKLSIYAVPSAPIGETALYIES